VAGDVFYGRRGPINARELWEQMMNTCSCLNLILCIVYWKACEISRVLSECDRSPIESISACWNTSAQSKRDNVVLYGQYISTGSLVRQRRRAKRVVLSV
jgi:hypothetical protein